MSYFYDWNSADCLIHLPYYETMQVGDEVVVQDGDLDLCMVRIVEITESPKNGDEPKDRKSGWARFEPLMETWVDGSTVVALAMNWVQQPSRNVPVLVRWKKSA